jgi:hypothetical protein
MTAVGPVRSREPLESTTRRRRARRVAAFAGMVTTVAGLVGLRVAMTPPPSQALGSSGLAAHAGTGGAGGGASAAHRPAAAGGGGSPAHRPASGGGASARTNRVVVGKAYDVSYGIVQVKVTISGTRITDITPMSLPQGGRSGDISRYAAPQLRREALSAQSAHIDSVSGASYTSAGYAMSLQSALDQTSL